MREIFFTLDLSIWGNFEQLWFLWQKSPLPPWIWEIFLHRIYPFSGNFQQLWFLWQKASPPGWEVFFTQDLSISGNFQQLWFLWQKSPLSPQDWGKLFYSGLPFQVIPSNFGLCGRKAPSPQDEEFFLHWIYPFQVISSNFGFCGRKAPPHPPPGGGKFFYTGSIHFRLFPATLVFVARKAPSTRMRENFFTLDLSISGNFEQCWILWQKSPLPLRMRESFYTGSMHFRQFPTTLDFVSENLSPPPPGWGKIFLHWIYPFQAILSNFGFCGRKAPLGWGKFFTQDLSISGNFQELWFLWQKGPPRMREFLHSIYPFQAIFSNFGFCGKKSPPPQDEGKLFLHWIYPFQAISSNFGFCGRKAPPPRIGKFFYTGSIIFRQFPATLVFVAESLPPRWGFFLHRIYPFQAIFSNFGFCGRKALSPRIREIFLHRIYNFQAISSNFGFCGRSLPPQMRVFFTQDLSISGNFHQLWFLWQKSPLPPGWGKFFYTGSIHFRLFPGTLVFVAERPPQDEGIFSLDLSISGYFQQLWFLGQKSPLPPGWGKLFLHWIYPFQAIPSNFGFCGRNSPSPTGWGKSFLHWIHPFEEISSNFGFCGRKAPFHLGWGNFFYTGSKHFRQFPATLVFVAEKPPPPGWGKFFLDWIYPFRAIPSNFGFCSRKALPARMREIFFTLDLSIWGNFQQLWFLWQKRPPPPQDERIFLHRIYPFQAISSNFGFCGRKPLPQDERNFFTLDLSISGNFQQLWFLWQKSPLPQDEGNYFYTGSIHFRQLPATLVFVAEKPP